MERLLENPDLKVRALVHSREGALGLQPFANRITCIEGDITKRESLAKAFQGAWGVINIAGYREFWSLTFAVTRHTLVPRPDSETLIEAALAWPASDRATVLDLGSGSGCLLAALLSERPEWWGLGLDIDAAALAVAGRNLDVLGLGARAHLVRGDWTECLSGPFDVVLCNPPYIADREWPDLEPEVAAFEPRIALAGGADGLACYRRIAPHLGSLMSAGGAVFFEVGAGQASAVAELLRRHALDVVDIKEDLADIPRCVVARRQD